ncbi:MAG: hypothetical protein ABI810_04710 [Sphingomonas bacterium]
MIKAVGLLLLASAVQQAMPPAPPPLLARPAIGAPPDYSPAMCRGAAERLAMNNGVARRLPDMATAIEKMTGKPLFKDAADRASYEEKLAADEALAREALSRFPKASLSNQQFTWFVNATAEDLIAAVKTCLGTHP